MSPATLSVVSICFALLVSAVSPQPTFLLPQQRSEESSITVMEPTSSGPVEYQLVPSGEYAVATVEPEQSLIDYVLSPITAVVSFGSAALSVVSWVLVKGGLVFLGMAIVIGFCALSSYCTMTIELPSFLARENIDSFPYLEQLESYFHEAYNKFKKMQNSV